MLPHPEHGMGQVCAVVRALARVRGLASAGRGIVDALPKLAGARDPGPCRAGGRAGRGSAAKLTLTFGSKVCRHGAVTEPWPRHASRPVPLCSTLGTTYASRCSSQCPDIAI